MRQCIYETAERTIVKAGVFMLNLKQGGLMIQEWVERSNFFFQKRPGRGTKYLHIGYHLENQENQKFCLCIKLSSKF